MMGSVAQAASNTFGDLLAPTLTLVVLLAGFAVMLRGVRARDPSAARVANFEVRTMTGGNLALVLGAMAVARFAFDVGLRVGNGVLPSLALVAGIILLGVATFPRVVSRLISILGLMSFWAITFLDKGPVMGLWLVVVSIGFIVAIAVLRLFRLAASP